MSPSSLDFPADHPLTSAIQLLGWPQASRAQAFAKWLESQSLTHQLKPESVRAASADASFRRYFRVDTDEASLIIMDAPPDKENSQPFVDIAALMRRAGLLVPEVLAWDPAQGFMLLDDLGQDTMMQVLDTAHAEHNTALFGRALDALLTWQQASRASVLPPYDAALLPRELHLFPVW